MQNSNWKTTTLIIGSLLGALTGFGAAYLLVKRAEELQEKPQLTTGDGMKLGIGIIGLLKLVADLANK